MALCEGGTLADVRHKLQKDFWPTFSAELTVWPVIQVGAVSVGASALAAGPGAFPGASPFCLSF